MKENEETRKYCFDLWTKYLRQKKNLQNTVLILNLSEKLLFPVRVCHRSTRKPLESWEPSPCCIISSLRWSQLLQVRISAEKSATKLSLISGCREHELELLMWMIMIRQITINLLNITGIILVMLIQPGKWMVTNIEEVRNPWSRFTHIFLLWWIFHPLCNSLGIFYFVALEKSCAGCNDVCDYENRLCRWWERRTRLHRASPMPSTPFLIWPSKNDQRQKNPNSKNGVLSVSFLSSLYSTQEPLSISLSHSGV